MDLRSFQYRVSDEMLRGYSHVEAVANVLDDPINQDELEVKLVQVGMDDNQIQQYVEEFRMAGWFDWSF